MAARFVLLSDVFYKKYPNNLFPEIEYKNDRPYLVFIIDTECGRFAIPLRSYIRHQEAFFTKPNAICGLDYTKAIFISDISYILCDSNPEINNDEFKKINENINMIKREFVAYLRRYMKSVVRGAFDYDPICKFSTLQYFHKELGLPEKHS
ncbi:MAG: hypothetical protein LBJ18_00190 [Rickettsiales bacterium]|jgi:protein AbiQ|nr:hypothetical protein [Rickettsiales bacterium]